MTDFGYTMMTEQSRPDRGSPISLPRRRALRRRAGPAVGPARSAGPDRDRGARPAVLHVGGRYADLMLATAPKPELGEMFDAAGGSGKGRVGQIALSYDPDREAAIERPRPVPLVRPRLEGQRQLPYPESFDAATAFVMPAQVAPFIRWAEDELLPALRSI